MPRVQLRATFTPEAWSNDQAIPVDPEGLTEWDCTGYAVSWWPYLRECADRYGGLLDGILDCDDVFKADPAAPEWVREWRGPFTIRIALGRSVYAA